MFVLVFSDVPRSVGHCEKTVRGRNRPVKPTFHLIMNLPLIWMRMFETDVSSEGFRLLRRSSYHESISLSALKACPAIN